MPSTRFAPPPEVPGLAARRIAADILDGVLHKHRTLDDQLDGVAAHPGLKALPDRDRALMRRLVATILRRLGTLGHVLSRLLDRGIPTDAPRAQSALLIGAAQILWMDVPDHAAVDLSVRLVQSDRRAAKYAGLVNAVLRRCAREGHPLIEEVRSEALDVPPWLLARWIAHYGEATAKAMALPGYKVAALPPGPNSNTYTAQENATEFSYTEHYWFKDGHAIQLRCVRPSQSQAGVAWKTEFDKDCEAIAAQLK